MASVEQPAWIEPVQAGWKRPVTISASVCVGVGLSILLPGVLAALGALMALFYVFWVVRGTYGHRFSGALALVFSMVITLGLSAVILVTWFQPLRISDMSAGARVTTVNADGEVSPATPEQLQLLAALPPQPQLAFGTDALIVLIMIIAAAGVSGLLAHRHGWFRLAWRPEKV